MFEGGVGKAVSNLKKDNPQMALTSGIAEQLKEMKWYESALLMKVAQAVPELQPLLGLAQGVAKPQTAEAKPQPSPAQASN